MSHTPHAPISKIRLLRIIHLAIDEFAARFRSGSFRSKLSIMSSLFSVSRTSLTDSILDSRYYQIKFKSKELNLIPALNNQIIA